MNWISKTGFCSLIALICVMGSVALAQSPTSPGIVVDDAAAELTGTWKPSTSVKGYNGAGYQHASGPEVHTATFKLAVPSAGTYHLLIGYTPGTNRSKNAPVTFAPITGEQTVRVDQQSPPKGPLGMHPLGKFDFAAGETQVVISTRDAQGVVIVDAIALLTAEQFALAQKQPLVATPAPKNEPKKEAKPEVPLEPSPPFVRAVPTKTLMPLTSGQLDALLKTQASELADVELIDDAQFIRRVFLDLIGRNPTRDELQAFVADRSLNKRSALIDQLLGSTEFGANWANYWSDVVSFRVPEPELTFLNYKPFKAWLAASINQGRGWDETTYRIVTAQGKVGDHPEATFIGFHQADKSRLASETTRVFLATQIQCAECHDHKFIDLPQKTFHQFAAFFARSQAKVAQNDSSGIEVGAKPTGEHTLPGKQDQLAPQAFELVRVELGASDMARRAELGRWMVSPENPFFAKAFVNRAWARLMGRGFCEPVDEIGELGDQVLPEIHAAVAEHFVATQFDVKEVYRLIANTAAYQRVLRGDVKDPGENLPKLTTARLRGDEVYQSLVSAIALPNVTPPAMKPTGAIRFPPPPKSTRDLVSDAFGFDPSMALENVARTMNQAMFMMNNDQVQKQINAKPESETRLAKILLAEADDRAAVKALFEHVLVRQPTPSEVEIFMQHRAEVKDRQAAFEDLLWSLLNSAEFTTRR